MPSQRKRTKKCVVSSGLVEDKSEGEGESSDFAGTTTVEYLASAATKAVASSSNIPTERALLWCHQARELWLNEATCTSDLDAVEMLYRAALNAQMEPEMPKKRKRKMIPDAKSYAALSPSDYRKAGERLSLLYIQSGRPQKAKPGLKYLGFTCRLAEKVLNYPRFQNLSQKPWSPKKKSQQKKVPPCCIIDQFLSNAQLILLQSVFCDANADYWRDHNYAVEPPSPYFSYVIPIRHPKRKPRSFLESLILQIMNFPALSQQFPLLPKAQFVELWAHNRPHASGHQLHFDSDNEGKGGVRNPIISTILYLSDPEDVGGPSLISTQTLQSTSLSAVRGWLAYARQRRIVAFDGKVLHGVIPGKGVVPSSAADGSNNTKTALTQQQRRVTLMLAFWKDIQVRDKPEPCAARPWPIGKTNVPTWAQKLNQELIESGDEEHLSRNQRPSVAEPLSIGHVYEDLNGNTLSKDAGLPEYEQVFQGF